VTKFHWRTDLKLLNDPDPAQRKAAAKRLAHAPASAFQIVVEMVLERQFVERDPEEALALLNAVKAMNRQRAEGVLRQLSSRTGLVSAKTRLVAELASELLQDYGASDKTPVPDVRHGVDPSLEATAQPTPRPIVARPEQEFPTGRFRAKTQRVSSDDVWNEDALAQPTKSAPMPWTAFQFTDEQARNALAWLRCPPFDPVPVCAEGIFEIGRKKDGNLVLAHPSVSRLHAVIRVAGEKMQLEDRSTYGTWVNGERVMSHEVQIGDTITIGPYDVLVEKENAAQVEKEPETRPLRTFASSEAIGGRIERVSLAEVLQQMEFNQKTGTLSVFADDGVNGTLVVYDGAPMYAEFGDARDNQAVIAMLNLKKGNFSFLNKIEPGEMTMQGTLTGILLEASRQIDEG